MNTKDRFKYGTRRDRTSSPYLVKLRQKPRNATDTTQRTEQRQRQIEKENILQIHIHIQVQIHIQVLNDASYMTEPASLLLSYKDTIQGQNRDKRQSKIYEK